MRIAALIIISVLTACAAGQSFIPSTREGAQCKANCAQNMSLCQGSSYTCDRAAATCMQSCQQLDGLSRGAP